MCFYSQYFIVLCFELLYFLFSFKSMSLAFLLSLDLQSHSHYYFHHFLIVLILLQQLKFSVWYYVSKLISFPLFLRLATL